MLKKSIGEWFRSEREKLTTMSWRKRLGYLWTYYRFHALAVICAVVFVVMMISGLVQASRDVLISGVLINTETSKEGYAYLSDGYWVARGGNRHTRVDLVEAIFLSYSQENLDMDSVTRMASIDTMIGARSLDYMILDESALSVYGPQGICADLSRILPEELYAKLADKIVTVHGIDSGEDYPAAVDLTDSFLAQRYGLSADPSYLVVVANAVDMEKTAAFLEYLFN